MVPFNARLIPLSIACAGLLLTVTPAMAAGEAVSDTERAKIEGVVKDYLMKNPAVIMEALQQYQQQQQIDQSKQFSDKFASIREDIMKAGHPTVGPADADVTIIEFYDYNCGYCKKAFSDVDQLITEDKKLRFVFIEMPILSETSMDAAKWAIAAQKQGKFYEFHTALMKYTGAKNKDLFIKIATDLKMDAKKAEADATSRETAEVIEKNLTLARDLGISGTPGFIFNDMLTPGYMGYEGMKQTVSQVRAKKDSAAN